ncbi:hypothetical protein, partial [uncultured Ruthenibacterium sp.]|uniref:hypothetical protein n=1 Tax=uncultured Ruthenibacterium sp. TaxID=1905347 RepID=UPI002599A986
MKEKLPGLFRPLMKFNVTAVMVIILMFSVFNVFSIVRTQQRQASLQTMALSQASQQIGDFIASAEQLGIVVQNDSQLMAYNLYNNRDLPHNIVWELEMLAPSVNSLSSLSIVYVDSLYPQINGVIYSSAGRFSYADYCRDELSGSLTENQLMEVVYAADHAHFVPQLSGNTRSLLYVMPIPSPRMCSLPADCCCDWTIPPLHAGCAPQRPETATFMYSTAKKTCFCTLAPLTATIS